MEKFDVQNFELGEEICQAIVDGTIKGYLNYLDERRKKKAAMNVSGAYAWTKGNHIDDQVSRIGAGQGLSFKIEKAGYSWEYLQFTVNENAEKYMIIVKNAKRAEQTFSAEPWNREDNNYLVELSEVNRALLQRGSFVQQPEQIELELNYPEEIRAVINHQVLEGEQKCARFYIVVYEINEESKLITSIKLTMPNNESMSLVQISDLTSLMLKSNYEITPNDVEVIMQDKISEQTLFSGGANAFGFEIPAEEKRPEGED